MTCNQTINNHIDLKSKRSFKELLSVATHMSEDAKLAVLHVSKMLTTHNIGSGYFSIVGIVAAVKAAAEDSAEAKEALEEAYLALMQEEPDKKEDLEDKIRSEFHNTLVKSAFANFLASIAAEAATAADSNNDKIGEKLANFIKHKTISMITRFVRSRPSTDELAGIEKLMKIAKKEADKAAKSTLDRDDYDQTEVEGGNALPTAISVTGMGIGIAAVAGGGTEVVEGIAVTAATGSVDALVDTAESIGSTLVTAQEGREYITSTVSEDHTQTNEGVASDMMTQEATGETSIFTLSSEIEEERSSAAKLSDMLLRGYTTAGSADMAGISRQTTFMSDLLENLTRVRISSRVARLAATENAINASKMFRELQELNNIASKQGADEQHLLRMTFLHHECSALLNLLTDVTQ